MEELNVRNRMVRVLFVLVVAALPFQAFAQSEVGISINGSKLNETRFDDAEEVVLDFDEGIGVGLTYDYFVSPRFSIEAALNTINADMTVSEDGGSAEEIGELSAMSLSGLGLFHFNTAGRFSPYVGGGIAFIGGEFEPRAELDVEAVDLETDITWTAALGANIRMTDRVFIFLESKWIAWEAKPEDEDDAEALDLDPLILSAGVKFRF